MSAIRRSHPHPRGRECAGREAGNVADTSRWDPAAAWLPALQRTAGSTTVAHALTSSEGLLALQRAVGNAAVARALASSRQMIQRFAELEHKAIGDRVKGDVQFRLSPMVSMTYGDLIAMGDYFSSPDEIVSLAATPGLRKGTIGEVYYALFVSIRGEDEKRLMGDWFDESAKEAVNARFYKLAANNIGHFPNPHSGDTTLDPRTKAGRHDRHQPVGEQATYRDGHVRAVRRALELGRARRPIGGALAIDAFYSHFLTDAFSAGHLRTPRVTVQRWWHRQVPDFYQRFMHWLADTMAFWVDHNGPQYAQAAPRDLQRKVALPQVRDALKALPAMTMGDVVATAVHDYDSDRGVIVELKGKRMRLVGDGRLLDREDADTAELKAAHTTMSLAVEAVQASVADIERAYEFGRSGLDLDAAIARLTKDGKGLFAAERMVPTPVPDDQLTQADRSLRWSFETVEELFADKRMRRALTIFANNKATMFDTIMDNPKFDRVAKEGLQVMVAARMASSDPNTVVGLFKEILAHAP